MIISGSEIDIVITSFAYLFLLIVAIAWLVVCFRRDKRYIGLLGASILLNVLSFLYFLGKTPYWIGYFNLFIWPVLNIVFVLRYFLQKNN